ncbi:hypothetical protein [Roseovarius sp.]|uniref:hypothetical protein n=1 Tax=Roseovarius sp. TaxID=1486281 RepID=UPI003B5B6986
MIVNREVFEATDELLHQTTNLLDALYDLAMESGPLGNSEPEAVRIMTLLEIAREKAQAAQQAHRKGDWV